MSHYIGDVEIPAINNVEIGKSIGSEEIDLVSYDENIVFESVQQASQIEISCSLVKSAHTYNKEIEDQRAEVKRLVSRSADNNGFRSFGFKGHLAVTDVSVAETSDSPTLREATISALYLPWPKHFPNDEPNTVSISMDSDAQVSVGESSSSSEKSSVGSDAQVTITESVT